MEKIIKDTIHANVIDIGFYTQDFENEFISLTDIARYKSDDSATVIQNWMRNRDVIEFLGLWERLHNPDFTPLEFEGGGENRQARMKLLRKLAVQQLQTLETVGLNDLLRLNYRKDK